MMRDQEFKLPEKGNENAEVALGSESFQQTAHLGDVCQKMCECTVVHGNQEVNM